jgi:hypothetical protein
LQAIFYAGNSRSTAVINRETVTVGERAGAYTVLAIEPNSVTLTSAGGAKIILQLDETKRYRDQPQPMVRAALAR